MEVCALPAAGEGSPTLDEWGLVGRDDKCGRGLTLGEQPPKKELKTNKLALWL